MSKIIHVQGQIDRCTVLPALREGRGEARHLDAGRSALRDSLVELLAGELDPERLGDETVAARGAI